MTSNIAPIFTVSCVKGTGLKLLYTFLNVSSPCLSLKEVDKLIQNEVEFQIDEIFNVADVGIVVGGLLTSGIIREGDWVKVGPLVNGHFNKAQVVSMHKYKVRCRVVRANESATLALGNVGQSILGQIRKGMVIISDNIESKFHSICFFFQARIHVLYHTTMICPGFQATIHIGNVCQKSL